MLIELKRVTVFYRCENVEKVISALKNLEKAEVCEEVLKSIEREGYFEVDAILRYGDVKIKLGKVKVFVKFVRNRDYFAVSSAPGILRVVADENLDDLSFRIAEHLKDCLNIKNAVDFFDPDAVYGFFKGRLFRDRIGISEIIEDFVKVTLKDFEDRTVIAKDCGILRYLGRFKSVVIVTDCPLLLDEIIKRVKLAGLSGRELRRLGYRKEDVIKPDEVEIYLGRVIE